MKALSDTILNVLKTHIDGLKALYLFGSAAAGEENAESDVDVAFLAESTITPMRRFEAAEALASALRRDVDLVDLRQASEVMRFEIISKGRRLFAADADSVAAFEDKTYMLYIDFNEIRAGILEEVSKRGSVY